MGKRTRAGETGARVRPRFPLGLWGVRGGAGLRQPQARVRLPAVNARARVKQEHVCDRASRSGFGVYGAVQV